MEGIGAAAGFEKESWTLVNHIKEFVFHESSKNFPNIVGSLLKSSYGESRKPRSCPRFCRNKHRRRCQTTMCNSFYAARSFPFATIHRGKKILNVHNGVQENVPSIGYTKVASQTGSYADMKERPLSSLIAHNFCHSFVASTKGLLLSRQS